MLKYSIRNMYRNCEVTKQLRDLFVRIEISDPGQTQIRKEKKE